MSLNHISHFGSCLAVHSSRDVIIDLTNPRNSTLGHRSPELLLQGLREALEAQDLGV